MNMEAIRAKLASQGAVLSGAGVISEVAANLVSRMWTATPGAGVYYTEKEAVYRLELDSRYRDFTADQYKVGLPMYDARVHYLEHQFDAAANRVLVYFEVIE